MSLSFPASPTNGQNYQNWQWNSSIGAWVPNYQNVVGSFNGRGGAVTFQGTDNTPGNKVLLSSQIVSASAPVAAVNFFYNFTNAYDVYEWETYDVQLSAAGWLAGRVSVDGSTFDTGNNYGSAMLWLYINTPGGQYVPSSSQSLMYLGPPAAAATPTLPLQSRIWLPTAWAVRARFFVFDGASQEAGNQVNRIVGTSYYGQTAAMKGLAFFGSSGGNITRGVFNMYGIVKAGAGTVP